MKFSYNKLNKKLTISCMLIVIFWVTLFTAIVFLYYPENIEWLYHNIMKFWVMDVEKIIFYPLLLSLGNYVWFIIYIILNLDHIHCDSDSDVEMEDNISSTNNGNSEVNTVNNPSTSNNCNSDVFMEYKITSYDGNEITLKKEFSLENSSPEYLSNSFHRKSMPETFSESISIRLSNSNAYTCELNKEALETLKTGTPIIFPVPNETDHTILYDNVDECFKVFRDLSHTDPTLVDEYG